jgi:hypothetical protein
VNPVGRLSTGKESTAELLEQTDPAKIDFGERIFANWSTLAKHAASTYPLGLAEFRPLDRIVVLKPAAWGERVFDELQQCFCWPLTDDAGQELVLKLPWNGVNETSVEFMEAVRPAIDKLTHVVARLVSDAHGTSIEPLSLLGTGNPNSHKVFCPGFDRQYIKSKNAGLLEKLRAKYGKDRIPTTMSEDDDSPGEVGADSAGGIAELLREYESILVGVAEAGAQRRVTGERAGEVFKLLRDSGLAELIDPFASTQPARELLCAGYVLSLHRQALRAVAIPK